MSEFFSKAFNVLILAVIVFGAGIFAGMQFNTSPQPSLEKLPDSKLEASTNIVAVTPQGKGVVNQTKVEVTNGSGRILLSINPFIEPDTQNSAQTAAFVAQFITGKSLKDKDVVFSIQNTEASLVGGPSAGAAFTLATIAAIEKKQVRQDAAITGAIQADGKIGEISGVIEKATAAAEAGLKLFVVPKGQSVFTFYEQKQEQVRRGGFTIVRTYYVPKTINLQAYLKDQGFNDLTIAEASSIKEAMQLMLE